MTGPQQGGGSPAQILRVRMLIRAALLLGVGMLGVVTYFQHQQNGSVSWDRVPQLAYVPIVALAIGLVGMLVLRAIWSRAVDEKQRSTLMIVGWAMGEGVALAGGVYYFITNDPRYYVTGILVLLASFMLFPIKRPE
jgi:hypothetical protein